jgi:hypothetical protein
MIKGLGDPIRRPAGVPGRDQRYGGVSGELAGGAGRIGEAQAATVTAVRAMSSGGARTRSKTARMYLQTQNGRGRLRDRTLSRRP